MAKPFVSKDGEDSNGLRAEVWVQVGTAQVTEIKPPRQWKPKHGGEWDPTSTDEKPSNVSVKFTNEQIRDGVAGWLSTSDPLYPKVLEAFVSKRDVEYRVEWQRNKDADRATPVKELRGYNEQTGRSDMGMCGQNGSNILAGLDGALSKEAVTNPDEDPDRSGRHSAVAGAKKAAAAAGPAATGAGLSLDAALAGLVTVRKTGQPQGVVDAAIALAFAAGATIKQVSESGVTPQGHGNRPVVHRARAAEAAPYLATNTDGRDNLGSYAVQAAFGAENLAYDLIEEYGKKVAEDDGVEPQPVNLAQAAGLANVLLGLADRVQVGAYDGGRPDRMANSHTRARSLVYDAVKKRHPVPFGATGEDAAEVRAKWADDIVEECVERFRMLAAIAMQVTEVATDDNEQDEPTSTDAQDEASSPAEPVADEPVADEPVANEPVAQAAPAQAAPSNSEQPPAAPTAAPAAPAAQQGGRPKPPKPGEDGFVAPDADVVQRFGALAQAAGFQASPDSPVLNYLEAKFGVRKTRDVHGPALTALVTWFEGKGDQAKVVFKEQVDATVGQPA